jgi:hypothetical protein
MKEIELEGVPDEVNDVLSGFARLSAISKLCEDIKYLRRWTELRCGNCDHWMKSRVCPKEKNVNGRNKGPSMNEFACELFSLKSYQIKYYNEECKGILENKYIQFIPDSLRPKIMQETL